VRVQCHAPAVLYPRKRPGTHCTGGWVGSRAGLDMCGRSRLPPGFDPRTVQLVASRYTDYGTQPTLSSIAAVVIPINRNTTEDFRSYFVMLYYFPKKIFPRHNLKFSNIYYYYRISN
jgi:hypothetical protein